MTDWWKNSVFYDELQFATRLAEYAGEEILTFVRTKNVESPTKKEEKQ